MSSLKKLHNDKIIIVVFVALVASAFAAILVVTSQHAPANNSTSQGVAITRVIDPTCIQCLSLDIVVNSFARAGIVIVRDVSIDYYSDEGRRLVQEYGITKLPAVILSKEISNYTFFVEALPVLDATERNGNYMLQNLRPPYKDIDTGAVVGLVDIIYLNDSSCSLCYNVLLHRQILQGYGIFILNETVVDVNSDQGRNIVSMFNVRAAPTFLASPDAAHYNVFSEDWKAVGSVVGGWYVFTNMTAINSIYKNLENGIIVVPA